MIKGVIFDADGTLLDSMEIWMEVTPQYLAQRGKILSTELQKKLYSMSLEEGCLLIKKEFSLSESTEEIRSGILLIIENFYKNDVLLKPGVFDFIQLLASKNIPMCVASAGNKELMESAFSRLNVLHYFKAILTCTELNVNKSTPDIFDKAAEILQTQAEETLVFEDSLLALTTAKKAGYKTAGVSDIFNQDDLNQIKTLSDYYVSAFDSKDFLDNVKEIFYKL